MPRRKVIAMKKVGVLGGVFDPIHIGHMHIADGVLRTLGLSKVILIPAGDPPHRRSSPIALGNHRYEMLKLAVSDNLQIEVSDLELRRSGKSYSVDTLIELRRIHPDWEIHFIMGADNLGEILTWKEPEKLFELSRVVVVTRPGARSRSNEINLPGRVMEIDLPGIDISSTQIRNALKDAKPCRYLLPPGVETYIGRHKLYA
ncbi:MAG: nicotinic acid mononucleotide adenylyltransferase [candidate division Zixibacteria bacterium CG_4_9_14_3_um_filter_46_8]|nr:MAG: nicotinic acid mononucleotide adenylyltransferase [candidate division Zixibacteria bacterium CG_4_9_14_3_um_filter_46_8]